MRNIMFGKLSRRDASKRPCTHPHTFHLSSFYLAWRGNVMAEIVKAFETQPKQNIYQPIKVIIGRRILLRGAMTRLWCKRAMLVAELLLTDSDMRQQKGDMSYTDSVSPKPPVAQSDPLHRCSPCTCCVALCLQRSPASDNECVCACVCLMFR